MIQRFCTHRPGGVIWRTWRTKSRLMTDFPFLVETLYLSQTFFAIVRSFSFPICWLFLPPRPINTVSRHRVKHAHERININWDINRRIEWRRKIWNSRYGMSVMSSSRTVVFMRFDQCCHSLPNLLSCVGLNEREREREREIKYERAHGQYAERTVSTTNGDNCDDKFENKWWWYSSWYEISFENVNAQKKHVSSMKEGPPYDFVSSS